MIKGFNELISFVIGESKLNGFVEVEMNFSAGNVTHVNSHSECVVDGSDDLVKALSKLKRDKYKGKVFFKRDHKGRTILYQKKSIEISMNK